MKKENLRIVRRLERVFSHAMALDQSGRFRNVVYIVGKYVYLMNTDHTVLLRFEIPGGEEPFVDPIGFRASDYDSPHFYEEDGRIVFEQKEGTLKRTKTCSVSEGESPEEAARLFRRLWATKDGDSLGLVYSEEVLGLLSDSLSHIEWTSDGAGGPRLTQRDLYTGNIIRIDTEAEQGFVGSGNSQLPEDWGPIGMRTPDFFALFSFQKSVQFIFSGDPSRGYCKFTGQHMGMQGVISFCLYDEMIQVSTVDQEENEDGRKESKAGRG